MVEKLEKFLALIDQEKELLSDQVSRAMELGERLDEGELIISVIGKFKSGKSSLINALLGEKLLPVGIIPLTTVITEIRSGQSFRAVVCFINGSEEEIKRSDMLDYISEQKNPNNGKHVSVIKLWTTYTPFDSAITLVDTPGVGSVHLHNTETSQDYIEKSDAVLFLLSVDSPVSKIELDFLLEARKDAAKFYFAVNKIDTISDENLQEFLSYCRVVISKAIESDINLYPISTKTGEGISHLKERLNYDLHTSYDKLLEESISIKLETIIAQAKAKLLLYLKAAKITTEELEIKISQIKEKQLLLNTLADEFQVLLKSQTDRLVEQIKEYLEEILPASKTAIQSKAQELEEELKSLPPKQFEAEFTAGLEDVLSQEIKVIDDAGIALLQEGYADIVDSFNKKAMDTSLYISEMVEEFFGVEYQVSAKTYHVSDRSDSYVRLLTLYERVSSWVYLLPREKANEKIFYRLMQRAAINLEENKTRIVYNYRYKMRESLRSLHTEFSRDIFQMSSELNDLLTHVKKSHNVQDEELHKIEEKYSSLVSQLDVLNERED